MFHISRTPTHALAALAAAALLAACGGGSSSSMGSVSVGITDMPAPNVTEVVVYVTGVAFKPEGAAPEVVPDFEPRSINLLEYQNGKIASLLEVVPMNPGRYQWLRLMVEAEPIVIDSYVSLEEGGQCDLIIPSGAESGLKMNRPFDVPEDGHLALTIDFDVMQSIRMPPGRATDCEVGYKLRPTLRLVANDNVGEIAGDVNYETGMVDENCTAPMVYIFQGEVTPDDVESEEFDPPPEEDVDPLAVVMVDIPEGEPSGSYRAAFLPPGVYTVALTCAADGDEDEPLDFIPPDGSAEGVVIVEKSVTTIADFTVPAPAP